MKLSWASPSSWSPFSAMIFSVRTDLPFPPTRPRQR
jgi:hypothetical protein